MKRLLSILLLAACTCLFGASCDGITSPDGDDIRHAVIKVRGIPDPMFTQLKAWAANSFTRGYLQGKYPNRWLSINYIECTNGERFPITIATMLDCLTKEDVSRTYVQCVKWILNNHHDTHPSSDLGPCDWADNWTPGLAPDELPGECSVEGIDEEDIIRAALPEPPPLWVQVALISGGVFGPAGVLCPLWMEGCPDDPLGDEEEEPNGPAPDGDR
jgi:hypothetical protein